MTIFRIVLGHVIPLNEIKVDKVKVKITSKLSSPKTVKEVHSKSPQNYLHQRQLRKFVPFKDMPNFIGGL